MKKRSKAATWQWNVPDWRDASLYPVPLPEGDDSDLGQWRWEFLRRDEEYRQDWLRFRALKHPFELALEVDPIGPGRNEAIYPIEYEERHGHIYYCLWKYKLARLLNPAHPRPNCLEFYPVPSDGVLVWFDLAMPLATQIRRADNILKKYAGRSIKRATLPEKRKWPLFLRVIDAFEEGVSNPDIGYRLLDLDKHRHDRNQATTNAKSHREIGRRFWKKLPIHRELPEYEGKLLGAEDLEPLFPPYMPRTGDDIDGVLPPKMPRVALPL